MAMVIPYLIVSVWTLVFTFATTIEGFQIFFPYKNASSQRRRITRTMTSFLSTSAGMLVLILLGS